LFYKDSAGVVQTLASKSTGTIGGSTTQVQYNNAGSFAGSANFVFDGTNVGIGTAGPSSWGKLAVYGTSSGGQVVSAIVNSSGTANTQAVLSFDTSASGFNVRDSQIRATNNGSNQTTLQFYTANATTPAEAMRIDASGNVGIGITPVSQKLEVKGNQRLVGDSAYILWRDTADSASSGVIQFSSASAATIGTYVNQAMLFQTNNAERMRIDTSGSLLVGKTAGSTTTLGSKIGGDGFWESVANQASTADGPQISIVNIASSVVNGYRFASFRINAGATQIGTITNNSSTGVLYNVTSDYRLKTVIGSVTDAGQRIDAIKPIEYEWNVGGRTRGFLAHQFAEVYPNSVSGEKDAVDENGEPKYQGMQAATSEVMADLIAEIQSLRKRVAQLESK
jgi:hypothetical protein